MRTWSVASGAGAYSKGWGLASSRPGRFAIAIRSSILCEVVLRLVCPGALLGDLHENVVEEARGAQPEAVRGHPFRAKCLPEQHQVGDGELGGADPARRFEADCTACLAMEVADRLHHD